MSTHMSSQLRQQQQQAKGSSTPVATQKQALNYELELFEQQMEDLISSETGVVTTVAASKAALSAADDESEESDDEDLGEWASDYEERNAVDYSEWSFALSEPLHLVQGNPFLILYLFKYLKIEKNLIISIEMLMKNQLSYIRIF